MKVLIVGGGIAGTTLAAFLENSAIDVDVVEKAPDWNHEGFLIALWDNGRDILRKLGLADAFDQKSTRVHTLSMRDGSGRTLKNYSLSHLYSNYGGVASVVERAELHALLRTKVSSHRIHMGVTPTDFVPSGNQYTVSFSDGTSRKYDCVVGADGIHSCVRERFFKDHIEFFENWRIWYAWIDNAYATPGSVVDYVEPGEFAVIFSGLGKTMIWVAAPATHGTMDSAEDRIARLKELFKDETAIMPGVLDSVRPSDIMLTDLCHYRLTNWSVGGVVLLGDAAHNFGPYAGIGGTLAMEDAYVLAGELLQVSATYPLETALQTFSEKRQKRVDVAEKISTHIRSIEFIKSPLLRRVTNFFIPLIPETMADRDIDRMLRDEI